MKWIFIMLALFKFPLLIISLLFLAACWPLEDNKKKKLSSEIASLPDIDHNLSSESPVGIWMLDIDATTEITNFHNNNIEIKSIEKSKHKIREFISIKQSDNENYIIHECSLHRKPNVTMPGWLNSFPSTLKDNILSLSIDFPIEDLETYQFVGLPLSSQTTLKFDNNLSLQGSASQLFKNRIFQTDPIFNQVSKDQHHLLQIKGVKVSDETNFFNPSELTTQFTINDIPFLNSEETAIRCLRIEDIATTITHHSDTPQEITHSSENLFSADFNHTNRVFLQKFVSDNTEKSTLTVFTNDSIFPNSNIPFYLSDCDENRNSQDKCKKVSSVKLHTQKDTSNTLESSITASTSDNNEINIKVSIEVH